MGARTMRVTVVGAVFIVAAAIVVVLAIRALSDKQGCGPRQDQPPEGEPASQERVA
jgi:hypothetical protein